MGPKLCFRRAQNGLSSGHQAEALNSEATGAQASSLAMSAKREKVQPGRLRSSQEFPARSAYLDAHSKVADGSQMIDEDQSDEIAIDERRQYDRSRLLLDVHFGGGEATGVASVKDMSIGGLYMSTQADIAVGQTLDLRIPLAGQHVIVKGDVVYSNPGHGVGVRFHRLSNEARQLMERELPKP